MALDSIIAHKRDEVARRKGERPLEEIERGLAPSERSLTKALEGGRTAFILECKKASPSRGVIREDYDPANLARDLAQHADAISVLADERFFEGKLADVSAVSRAVSLPVLMKDFTIDPYQVYEARAHGADAILMIMAALDDEACGKILDEANKLNMDVLVEVHNEEELARALKLDARVIGINSRNLKTLEVDLGTFERLAPLVPDDRILVAESGVKSHADVRRLLNKADAFLVGSSIMERDAVARAAREIVYGRVKVCGLTRPEDARAAEESGATYGGFIFASESPRRVDADRARRIMGGVDLDFVGVFANEKESRVASVAKELKLSAVQLHGDETDDYIAKLKGNLPAGCEIWKAHRVRDELPSLEGGAADRILLDTFAPDKKGGTGQSFDWSLLAGHDLERVILSGGLEPKNAREADLLGAYALDVNSGVESAPGKKDRKLIDAFFSNLRGGGRRSKS